MQGVRFFNIFSVMCQPEAWHFEKVCVFLWISLGYLEVWLSTDCLPQCCCAKKNHKCSQITKTDFFRRLGRERGAWLAIIAYLSGNEGFSR